MAELSNNLQDKGKITCKRNILLSIISLATKEINGVSALQDSFSMKLKRVFSKFAGMSVHKYFLNLKLNAALKLLQSGKTVTEVTETLNFSSQSYFSSAFKRETGKLPSEFKNSIISKSTR